MSLINELVLQSPSIKEEFKENIILKISRKGADEGGDKKFFNQYWQPFAWAATIGFISGRRVPIEGRVDSDTFKYSVINNQAPDIFKALIIMAIGKIKKEEDISDEIDSFKSPEEIKKIIDEFANGGFEIINRKLADDPDYFYDHNKFIEDLLKRQ